MKVTDSLYVLPIQMKTSAGEDILHLSLILDEQHGPTLVDAAIPGKAEEIADALKELGLGLSDIRRLILTHQDMDHIGSAAAVVAASKARVLAHAADAPYMDGRRKWIKLPPPQALEQLPPEMRARLERGADPVQIDQQLQGGELLDIAGGVRVIFTPGHTPGHISLYLEQDRALITGDAVVVREGRVQRPVERATPDMPEALRSVAKLADLEIETLIAYHGGLVRGQVSDQLRQLL